MGKIKAVRKYENPIEFAETHKLWMDANHRPTVRGSDNAIWNRLHLIPFNVTIPKEEQDRGLSDKLRAEAEAIIAWAVYGAQRWWKEGLGKPPEIAEAVSSWRKESQPLRDFIADQCSIDPSYTCTVKVIRQCYQDWCEQVGEKPLSAKDFKEALEALGCHQDRLNKVRFWKGIRVEEVTSDNR
jgi:putative DNA primase/helicase